MIARDLMSSNPVLKYKPLRYRSIVRESFSGFEKVDMIDITSYYPHLIGVRLGF